MKLGLIYKANFPNGKAYIGKTINFLNRYKVHKSHCFNTNSSLHNLYFYKAARKYKWENIEWEILENEINIDLLNQREMHWIATFCTFNPTLGYNSTIGGDGFSGGVNHPSFGKQRPEEIKKRISQSHLGILHSEETKRKISISMKDRFVSEATKLKQSLAHKNKPSQLKGRNLSEEHKKNISKALKGKSKLKGKPWSQKRRDAANGEA